MHMWALNAGSAVNLCQLCRMAPRHLHGLPGAADYGLECCHAKHMWGICYAHLAGGPGVCREAVQAECSVSPAAAYWCFGLLKACTVIAAGVQSEGHALRQPFSLTIISARRRHPPILSPARAKGARLRRLSGASRACARQLPLPAAAAL